MTVQSEDKLPVDVIVMLCNEFGFFLFSSSFRPPGLFPGGKIMGITALTRRDVEIVESPGRCCSHSRQGWQQDLNHLHGEN